MFLAVFAAVIGGCIIFPTGTALAQNAADNVSASGLGEKKAREMSEAEAARKVESELAEEEKPKKAAASPGEAVEGEGIDILTLLLRGGSLMWPIGFMSLLVVTFGAERLLALRRRKVIPPELVKTLLLAAEQPGGFDPRRAYRLCQEFPSTAATVIRAALLKIGRPIGELERAALEAEQREAGRLYSNVRWLGLAATVTPLLGLLGTVWGMINAFFVTANLPTGANKAEALAEGIYIALVTTLAGLSVAIPAALLAHAFEGRIQKLFRELDEVLLELMPRLERFEGRVRTVHGEQNRPPSGDFAHKTPEGAGHGSDN